MTEPSQLPAYLRSRGGDGTYTGTTASGEAAGTFVVEYGQMSFVLEDLAAHEIWVPMADGEAVPRDEVDTVVARCWGQGRPLDYGCHRMVTARGLPRWPLRWFAGDDAADGEAGSVEPLEYVSLRFVPYPGQWSQADPEDVAGTLSDGRTERGTSGAEEPPDLEIRVPLPAAIYEELADRVRTGTTPVTAALVLPMARLCSADPATPHQDDPAGPDDTLVLASAPADANITLVSLSLHGPGALSPHIAGSFWPDTIPPIDDDAYPNS